MSSNRKWMCAVKLAFPLAVIILLVVADHGQAGPLDLFGGPSDPNSCLLSSQCGPGMCCSRYGNNRRKRFVQSLFDSGTCAPLRTLNEGCWDWHRRDSGEEVDLYNHCPCAPGLECRSEDVVVVEGRVIEINHKCQPAR